MISEKTKKSLNRILQQSVEITLEEAHGDEKWTVDTMKWGETINCDQFILITLCCLESRFLVSIHCNNTPTFKQHIAGALNTTIDKIDDVLFKDYLSEWCNQFCALLKRALSNAFPILGVSTLAWLPGRSYEYFELFKTEYSKFYVAESDSGIQAYFGMDVCPIKELDFTCDSVDSSSDGELEFF